MENRVHALDGVRVFRARKRPKTTYGTVKIKVLGYWTVEMHSCSETGFHVLHKASVFW